MGSMALNSAKSSTENTNIPTTSMGIKIVTKTISNADLYKLGFGHPFGPCSLIFYSLVGTGIFCSLLPIITSGPILTVVAQDVKTNIQIIGNIIRNLVLPL